MFDVSDESGVGRLIYFLPCLLITFTEILRKYCYFKPAGSKIIWVDATWN